MGEERGRNDLLLMTFGAILLADSMQRSTNAATMRVRADILRKLGLVRHRWTRRGANASNTLELVAGAALVAYALIRVARSADATEPGDTEPLDTQPDRTPPAVLAPAA